MLARRFRLKRSPLLVACFKKGRRLSKSQSFDILALPNDQPERMASAKFTVVVSKKVSNKANKRNLIRRRLYHLIREEILAKPPEKLKGCSAVIVIVKPDCLGISFSDLKQEFLRCILNP